MERGQRLWTWLHRPRAVPDLHDEDEQVRYCPRKQGPRLHGKGVERALDLLQCSQHLTRAVEQVVAHVEGELGAITLRPRENRAHFVFEIDKKDQSIELIYEK